MAEFRKTRKEAEGQRAPYLRRLWKKTDGDGEGQAEGGQTHGGVDRQDQPGVSLQQGEPGGTRHQSDLRGVSVRLQHNKKKPVEQRHSDTVEVKQSSCLTHVRPNATKHILMLDVCAN